MTVLNKVCLYLICFFISASGLAQTYNVLFIGNSLTYTNDLPTLVENEAQQRGLKVKSTMTAKPNYALVDHWDEGEIQKHINMQDFDFVIVQQGPSSQPYGRKLLIDYAKKLNKLCKKNESQLVIFMVWPSQAYYHTFDDVIESHKLAANATDALLCPVGEQWKAHFDRSAQYDYYGPDGFHPSLKGSKVAAAVIVETLFAGK